MKLPVRETTLPELVEGYRAFARLDVSHFDRVITSKYPAWIVAHPYHVVWMFHPLRGLYDTYHTFGMPERAEPTVAEVADLVRFLDGPPLRSELDGCFELWDRALRAAGPDHPELTLPSPVARRLVHWLDAVALSPPAVRRHLALSATIAARPGYFPPGTDPIVAHAPSDLPARTGSGSSYLFTASRLDGPKRLDLLIDAMAHVPQEIPLLIGGTGPRAEELKLARRHRPAGEVPGLRARPRPRRPLRQRAGGALRPRRRGLRAHHRRGHGLRHPGGDLHRQRRADRADLARGQRPGHGADPGGAGRRAGRAGGRARPGPEDGAGRPLPRPRPHVGLDGGHRPRLAVDRPAPAGARDRPHPGGAGHHRARGGARPGARGRRSWSCPRSRSTSRATVASSAAPTCTGAWPTTWTCRC